MISLMTACMLCYVLCDERQHDENGYTRSAIPCKR